MAMLTVDDAWFAVGVVEFSMFNIPPALAAGAAEDRTGGSGRWRAGLA